MSLPCSYLQPEEPNVYAKIITHTMLSHRWRALAGGGGGAMVGTVLSLMDRRQSSARILKHFEMTVELKV